MSAKWEVRQGSWHPDNPEGNCRGETFSVTVNLAGSRSAAPFRVSGPTSQPKAVDLQAEALRAWLESAGRGTWVGEIALGPPARITVTATGRKMGFQPAGRLP